ncbi:PrGVORF103 [Pieris rapae granulovirus Wuhan]|uniref:PrGVORF103 n=1 Tax=Pieris rapae granulovirus Wuhan TaxID=2848030 RepID=D2J4S0_9BBAC|nr:PrGVORF103 [Betabaculovirus arrapae]ACZ63589.1 PrGVORF103 [Betabaculovirus arrapae]ADO85531.1 unknown [Pieris rapae granulovirus]AGS18858.1 hypothetical protein [Pieris rapae granulovirus]UOS85777.1 ORF103 [Pieris rapae granulovirus]
MNKEEKNKQPMYTVKLGAIIVKTVQYVYTPAWNKTHNGKTWYIRHKSKTW